MIRTQIQLDERQAEALKRMSVERGVSLAALIRLAVDALIKDEGREERIKRVLAASGKFRSGLGDVAENHDRYLAEDFA